MSECMTFPDTVEEFIEQYKVVDADHVYSNGIEFIPIFRMKQWFEHLPSVQPYTDEQIQKMQDMHQAEIEKAFELGREDAKAEIVRCKDCIYYHQPICLMSYDGKEWSEDDGFCHVGKRREDDF